MTTTHQLNPALTQRFSKLCSKYEGLADKDPKVQATLTALDAKLCDNVLTQDDLATAERKLKRPALFGDYELIIDACLNGDPTIKRKVAEADAKGRRGLATLKYHLQRNKAKPSGMAAHALRICELDQEYYESLREDLSNITILKSDEGHPRYQVRMQAAGQRIKRTFHTLTAAQNHRDIAKSQALHFRRPRETSNPQTDNH